MAARTGFEPVNAALRGLWLQPLAERAMYSSSIADFSRMESQKFQTQSDHLLRSVLHTRGPDRMLQ